MNQIRLAASAAVTLILLGFAALLWGPAFDMPTTGRVTGIGSGALPQFCIIAAAVLAILIFVRDLVAMRRSGAISGPADFGDGADPRRVVLISLAALAALSAYVAAWVAIGFPPATIGFLIVMSLMLLPRERWSLRSIVGVIAMGVLFGLGVWALFVYALQVPLR